MELPKIVGNCRADAHHIGLDTLRQSASALSLIEHNHYESVQLPRHSIA